MLPDGSIPHVLGLRAGELMEVRISQARRYERRALLIVALGATLVASGAALGWSTRYSVGTSWDEAEYLNIMVQQIHDARGRALVPAVKNIVVWTDGARPPAWRLAALPIAGLFGPDPRVLRALCLAALLASAALIYAAARLVSEQSVAIVAAVCYALSYAPLWASARFGTEYALYLATAGLFYCLVFYAVRPPTSAGVLPWAGLAAAMALGALSKGTFLAIALPAICAFVALGWWSGLAARTVWLVATAALGGLIVASPWWVLNYQFALAYAHHSSNFVRHNFPWLTEAFWNLLGPPIAALIVGLVVWLFRRRQVIQATLSRHDWLVLVTCVAGIVPLLVLHMLQANHLARLVSPVLIPAFLGAAVLAQAAGLPRARGAVAVAATAILLQSAYLTHDFLTSAIDPWDWDGLLALCDRHGVPEPVIKHIGHAGTFNPPAMSFPWIRRGRTIHESWLWRFEAGRIDWNRINTEVGTANAVVTAPNYRGNAENKEPLDNQYNEEMVARLKGLPQFEPPVELRLGRFGTRVLVFFRGPRGQGAARSP